VCRAAPAAFSAVLATSRTERLIVSMAWLTVVISRAWAWAPPAIWSVAPIISFALPVTRRAACRTSASRAAISSTMTLMESTTLPRTSGVTWPRRERSPWEISMTVSRNVWMFFWRSSRFFFSSSRSVSVMTCDWMFFWRSSRFFFSSSRSVSVMTCERRRTTVSLNVWASRPISSREATLIVSLRSPRPTRSATFTMRPSGRVIRRAKSTPASTASTATPPNTANRNQPARAAAASMIVRSMPTRTVPMVPPSIGTPMSMMWCGAPVTGSAYPISRTCLVASPGTRFLSTRSGGTNGTNVWAIWFLPVS